MPTKKRIAVNQLTPVLIVEAVEPCLPFWRKLGFEKTMEVQDGDRLGFAILARGGVELMLQSRRSIAADLPGAKAGPAVLYLDVEGLDAVEKAVEGAPVVHPRRKATYGADEIWVRDPGGNVIGFAEHA